MVVREITEPIYEKGGTTSHFDGGEYKTLLIGEPNVYNAASAISLALALGVSGESIQKNISTIAPPPGRFVVFEKKGTTVIVDYAHEPASLEALYKTAQIFKPHRLIGILGAQGGGRDVWKREAMGKVAGEYCNEVILTNEDPYDENPTAIAEAVRRGIQNEKTKSKIEINREEAIQNSIRDAKKGDVIVISGKGGEVWMCVAEDKKIPWSDEKIVEKILSEK
jgi:UDP-N-acetylmuramoyl-L-alanyl-D-glutamate--2,6-diaminopimelate ligase